MGHGYGGLFFTQTPHSMQRQWFSPREALLSRGELCLQRWESTQRLTAAAAQETVGRWRQLVSGVLMSIFEELTTKNIVCAQTCSLNIVQFKFTFVGCICLSHSFLFLLHSFVFLLHPFVCCIYLFAACFVGFIILLVALFWLLHLLACCIALCFAFICLLHWFVICIELWFALIWFDCYIAINWFVCCIFCCAYLFILAFISLLHVLLSIALILT